MSDLSRSSLSQPADHVVDSHVGGFMGISLRDPKSLLRGFDVETKAVTYQGKVYDLLPMIEDLQRLAEVAGRASGLPWADVSARPPEWWLRALMTPWSAGEAFEGSL
jgi:hypothetical protein